MPRIVVSERAYEMLHRYARKELRGAAKPREDGLMDVQICGALKDELKAQQFPGETFSAVILRFMPTRTDGRR